MEAEGGRERGRMVERKELGSTRDENEEIWQKREERTGNEREKREGCMKREVRSIRDMTEERREKRE